MSNTRFVVEQLCDKTWCVKDVKTQTVIFLPILDDVLEYCKARRHL